MLLLPGKGNCLKLLQIIYRFIRSTFAGPFSSIHFLLDSWEKFSKLSLISFLRISSRVEIDVLLSDTQKSAYPLLNQNACVVV